MKLAILCLLLGASRGVKSDSIRRADATNCLATKNGARVCSFNADNLVLDDASVVQLTVTEGGKTITCTRGERGENLDNWYGDCDGNARDANFVNVEDHEGNKKLFGSIAVGSDVCQISTTVGGGSSITCSKPIKKDLTHEIPEGVVPPLVGDDDGERKLQFGFAPSPNSVRGQRDSRRLFDDSGSTIDIMVVWSKAAECGTSSLLSPCTFTAQTELAILGKINLALAYTNTAFAESQISTQLRLVHAYQHPSYVEPLTGWRDYDALVGMADDGVKAKRALYGADMVAFIIESPPSSCSGVAWTPDWAAPARYYKDQMYSVTGHRCLLWSAHDVLSHEIAHNIGAYHDRGTEDACSDTSGSYNYGWRDPVGSFISIMGYQSTRNADGTPQCDKIAASMIWSTAPRFSNPNITYQGKAIGSPRHNNARFINEKKAGVAAMLPAMNCRSNAECNDNDAATIDTCNVNNGACVFTPRPAPVPTKMPVNPPTHAPTGAPIKPPTKSPVTRAPTVAPVKPPTKAPITRAPVKAPTKAPVKPLTKIPTASPTDTPTSPIDCESRMDSPLTLVTGQTCAYNANPVTVVSTSTATVTIAIQQTWTENSPVGLIATQYAEDGVLLCDPQTEIDHTNVLSYQAQCTDGYAQFDFFVQDETFSDTLDNAMLPAECEAYFGGEDGWDGVGHLCHYSLKIACACDTPSPTNEPTKAPVKAPTKAPLRPPTKAPLNPPTKAPVLPPTKAPVKPPSKAPVKPPTNAPVRPPTKAPVKPPTNAPVRPPTKAPVKPPTTAPVKPPTNAPVKPPTKAPVKPPTKAPVKPPTKAPVKPPTKAPVRPPTKAPVKPPTKAPVKPPTKAPVKPPTKAPVKPPTKAPVHPPTKAPVKPPTKAPVKPPTKAPVKPPTKAPVKPPTKAPVKPPTKAPVKPPTKAPVKPPTKAPVKPPTKAPVKPPTNAPVKPPAKAPVKPPTKAPVKPPTKAPVKPPTKAPVKPPTKAPVRPPTKKPSAAPTGIPTLAPTEATWEPTTLLPTAEPTLEPTTSEPTLAPTLAPTMAPVKPPTAAPVKPPTAAPTAAPVKPPTSAPVKPPPVSSFHAENSIPDKLSQADTVRAISAKNARHDPDGIWWLKRESWTPWDGKTTYNPCKLNTAELQAGIFPGSIHTMRGLREVFYQIKPFANNTHPTVAEIERWNIEVIRHFRRLLGFNESTHPVENDKCTFLKSGWAEERSRSNYWSTKYPGSMDSAAGPCTIPWSKNAHCGASFLPSNIDQAPYMEGTGLSSCGVTAGAEGILTTKTVPWAVLMSRVIGQFLWSDGIGAHTGPYVGRSKFGSAWYLAGGESLVLRGKWSGNLAPTCL